MVVRTEARMASVLLACLLALLAPLRVAAQCTPLGVAVEFVAPSDSGHELVTEDSEVAKNTALCHVACLNLLLGGDNITNGTNVRASYARNKKLLEALFCYIVHRC